MAESRQPKSQRQRRIVIFLDRCVFWLTKHWLACFNLLAFLYVGLPILAAVLVYVGASGPGQAIHVIYKPLCHQLPERSWHLFGDQVIYSLDELAVYVNLAHLTPENWKRELTQHPGKARPIFPTEIALAVNAAIGPGNDELGYKIPLCQRDTAIYGAIFLFGVAFAIARKYREISPLPWWAYVGFGILPMLLDGGSQWLTFNLLPFIYWKGPALADVLFIPPYETWPILRVITGSLFGIGTAWLAYPHLQEAMDDFHETLHKRFGWR